MVAVKVLNMTRILNNTNYGTRKEAHFPVTKPNYTQTRTQTDLDYCEIINDNLNPIVLQPPHSWFVVPNSAAL